MLHHCQWCIAGDFHDASRLVDMGASITSASDAQLQAIIEQLSIPERYHILNWQILIVLGN
jgi:hypothetical protein